MSSKQSTITPLLRRVMQDQESQICFGAALINLVVGLIGLALNMFITLPTTLDALLVISVFFGLLGTVRAAHLRHESAPSQLGLPQEKVSQEDRATHDQEKTCSAA